MGVDGILEFGAQNVVKNGCLPEKFPSSDQKTGAWKRAENQTRRKTSTCQAIVEFSYTGSNPRAMIAAFIATQSCQYG